MTRPADEEPVLDVAQGDPALSRHLRNSLKLLRDRTEDRDFQRLADDVLAGRLSLREVATSPSFARVLNPEVERFAERYEALTDEERAELAAQGEQQLAEERERIAREKRDRERWLRDHDEY